MKKLGRAIFLAVLVLILAIVILTACNNKGHGQTNDNTQDKKPVVIFIVDGVEYSRVETKGNEIIVMPTNPKKDGYTFVGWFWDKDTWQRPFTANSMLNEPMNSDMKVYAYFEKQQQDLDLRGVEIKTNTLTVDGANISGKVANEKTIFSFIDEISVADSATYTVSTDINGSHTIKTKTVNLAIGDNTYYILVENGKEIKLYNVSIRRRPIYTVTFDSNGGTEVKQQQIEEDSCATEPTTERKGYTFDKWDYDFSKPIIKDTTITASWNIITYNVYYNLNVPFDSISQDVDNNMNVTTYTVEDAITFKTPSRKGYRFTGWDKEIKKGTIGDVTVTAGWEVIEYDIVYDFGDANSVSKATNNAQNPSTYTIEDAITFAEPSRTGYTFVAWDKNIARGTIDAQTITASWEIIEYDIAYDFGDSKSVSKTTNNAQNPSTYTIEDTITFAEPSRNGYTFVAWDKSIASGTIDTQTITASWEAIKYDIVYDFGDADSVSKAINNKQNPSRYTIEDAITFAEPSRDGYRFIAWDKNIVRGTIGTQTITASWEVVKYDIAYDFGDNNSVSKVKNLSEYPSSYTIEDVIEFVAPIRDGYEFKVFNIQSILSGTIGTKTITASWEIINYDISYDFDDVDSISKAINNVKNPRTYTIEDNIIFSKPSRDGYTFVSWNKNIARGTIGTQTVTASWNINKYTITYILNGWENSSQNVDAYTIEDGTITLYDAIKGESLFCGWYLDEEFKNYIATIDASTMHDYMLHAYADDSATEGLFIENGIVKRYSGVLPSVVMPSYYKGYSVTDIGNSAFRDCSWITSITIPYSVTSIGGGAFGNCRQLTTVNWNAIACTKAGSANAPLFPDCSSFTTVNIGDNVTTIPSRAFSFCRQLTDITIPASLTNIDMFAFFGCSGLQDIYITDVKAWCAISGLGNLMNSGANKKKLYINNELVTSITIPNGVTSIPSSAFHGCTGLTSITIPDSVTSIGKSAFAGCTGLTSVTIPNSVTSIGERAFSDSSGLKSVTIGNSVTDIGSRAFYGCNKLTSLTIPDSVTSIGDAAFKCCNGLTSISVGSKNTKYHSFDNCLVETASKKLILGCETSVIPTDGSVTSIGNSAFYGCSGLTNITIPNSVTSIGEYAFSGCRGLTNMIISNSVTSIGDYAFQYCSGLTSITIPDSVKSIGKLAFYVCSNLASITYKGTKSQWESVSKGTDWNSSTGSYKIYCNDGTLDKN